MYELSADFIGLYEIKFTLFSAGFSILDSDHFLWIVNLPLTYAFNIKVQAIKVTYFVYRSCVINIQVHHLCVLNIYINVEINHTSSFS